MVETFQHPESEVRTTVAKLANSPTSLELRCLDGHQPRPWREGEELHIRIWDTFGLTASETLGKGEDLMKTLKATSEREQD